MRALLRSSRKIIPRAIDLPSRDAASISRKHAGKMRGAMIQAYVDSAETKETIRRVSRELSDSGQMSYEAQTRALADAKVSVSADAVRNFAKVQGTKNPSTPKLKEGLWKVFAKAHPILLTQTYEAVLAESRVGGDLVANTLHHFWRPDQNIDIHMLDKLCGSYEAFFPFFADPSKLIVASLECGIEGHPTKFRLVETYTEFGRRERTDVIEGRIVPAGDTVMFVGQIVGQETPFIFALFGFPTTNGKVEWSDGTTLVAARGVRPSAYPIYIVRRDALPSPRVISHEQADQEVIEWPEIKRVLGLGMVRWPKAGEHS